MPPSRATLRNQGPSALSLCPCLATSNQASKQATIQAGPPPHSNHQVPMPTQDARALSKETLCVGLSFLIFLSFSFVFFACRDSPVNMQTRGRAEIKTNGQEGGAVATTSRRALDQQWKMESQSKTEHDCFGSGRARAQPRNRGRREGNRAGHATERSQWGTKGKAADNVETLGRTRVFRPK